jgi:hypothetical protein
MLQLLRVAGFVLISTSALADQVHLACTSQTSQTDKEYLTLDYGASTVTVIDPPPFEAQNTVRAAVTDSEITWTLTFRRASTSEGAINQNYTLNRLSGVLTAHDDDLDMTVRYDCVPGKPQTKF